MEKTDLDKTVKNISEIAGMVETRKYKKPITPELARMVLKSVQEIIDSALKK